MNIRPAVNHVARAVGWFLLLLAVCVAWVGYCLIQWGGGRISI